MRYHIQRESADGFGIIGVGIQFEPQPARDFCAAHIGKAHQLGKAVHGDDAGDDGDVHACALGIVHKVEIGIGVEKILRDGAVRACVHFLHEVAQIVGGVLRLRVVFGVGSNDGVELVAEFLFDQRHQFVGVAQAFHAKACARWDVAAQGNQAVYAEVFVLLQQFNNFVFQHADAGQMGGDGSLLVQNIAHGLQRALAR